MYLVRNHNLLFHGCVPLNEDGTFSSMNCLGTWRSGRDYLDFCDEIARRAWRERNEDSLDWMWYLWIGMKSPASGRLVKTFERSYIDDPDCWAEPMDPYRSGRDYLDFCDEIARRAWRERNEDSLDWMWYLWIGMKSPASGRLVKTFERSYIDDPDCWAEPMDPYFELTKDEATCDAIMAEFGVSAGSGHIVDGHTPVHTGRVRGFGAYRGRTHARAHRRGRAAHSRERASARDRRRLLQRVSPQDGHRWLHPHLELARVPSQGARARAGAVSRRTRRSRASKPCSRAMPIS